MGLYRYHKYVKIRMPQPDCAAMIELHGNDGRQVSHHFLSWALIGGGKDRCHLHPPTGLVDVDQEWCRFHVLQTL